MEYSTFEATPFFRTLMRTEFGLKEVSASFESGEIIFWKHSLYNRYISAPFRDRAAHISDSHKLTTVKNLKAPGSGILCIKDVEKITALPNGFYLRNDYINSNVHLDSDIIARMEHSARKNYKKALNNGLNITVNSFEYFDKFYRCYLATRKRLGVLPYSKNFFKYIINDKHTENRVFFTCMYENAPVGFLICYLHNGEMISAHIAYSYEHRNLRITDFLFINAFIWGAENNYTIYRFGADNKEQKTLLSYKRKLGAVHNEQYDAYFGPDRFYNNAENSLIRKCLAKTPAFIYPLSSIGTKIYFQ